MTSECFKCKWKYLSKLVARESSIVNPPFHANSAHKMEESAGLQRRRKTFFRRLHSFNGSEQKELIVGTVCSDPFSHEAPVRKISEPCRSWSKSSEASRKMSEPNGRFSRPHLTVLHSPPIATGIWNWYSRLSTNVKKNLHSPKVIKRFLVSSIFSKM